MSRRSSSFPQICSALAASLIFVCAGFHYRWFSISVPEIMADESLGPVSLHELSWIAKFLFIGIIASLPYSVILVNILGRRTTLILTTIPLVLSCALITFARYYWWFYLARFLAGLGYGVAFTVTPMYIGEIAESRIRGSLGVLMFVMFYIGQLIVTGIGPLVSKAALGIVGGILPIVFGTALLWVPESPYYYAMKKAPKETLRSLAWLRGSPDVGQEVQLIQNSIAINQRNGVNFMKLFTVVSNRKALAIVFGLLTCKALTDTSLIEFMGIFVYEYGVATANIWVFSMLVSTVLIIPLIDVVGRRPLLLASTSLCAIFSLATALHFQLYGRSSSWILAVSLVGYLSSYSLGIGTIPLVFSAEFFPCEVKAFALGLCTAYTVALGFVIEILIQVITMNLGNLTAFYLLLGFNIVSTVFIFFGVPETKKFSLSEIQTKLHGHFRIQV